MIIGRQHTIKGNIRSILLIQLGDIGDVVWATPTFQAVKETYPDANMSVLLREGSGCLIQEDPSIYKIFEVKRYQGSLINRIIKELRFLREVQSEKFDLVIDLRADDRGAIMAFMTRAPIRGAQHYLGLPCWRNRLFTHLVDPLPPKEKTLGAAEQSLRVVRGFGVEAKTTIPRLWVSDQVMKRVRQILSDCKIKPAISEPFDQWITLNPFSRWAYKEWACEKWVHVINWLWNDFRLATVIVGSKEEKERAAELSDRCEAVPYNLAGKTSLAELAGLLSLSYLHIGVDSAAPHIAAAVGTRTITIYGPSNWRDWAPVGDQHRVISPDMDCVPCRNKGCDGLERSLCLETLVVDRVQRIIQEELEKRLG
jgi:ADP-heptose:LPS heptosyltransferase